MKLRVTFDRAEGGPVDLAITYDSSATVADVAEKLLLADPARTSFRQPDGLTLAVKDGRSRIVDPQILMVESGIYSGQSIQLAQAGAQFHAPKERDAAAILQVHSGPDLGKQFPLASGSNLVGRKSSCTVCLEDPLVSREHIRINITDFAEVIDLGSANGVLINDQIAEREPLQPTDQVTIGDTTFTVRVLHHAETSHTPVAGGAVAFIRSPRLVKPFPGEKFELPDYPERSQPQRFPTLVLIAPIIMAGIMYWATRQPMTLLFMALSPLMMLGSYFEQLLSGRAAFKRALKVWRGDLEVLAKEICEVNQQEVSARNVENPSVVECVRAARERTNLLWTRRLDSPGFGEFRFGLGQLISRSEIEFPNNKKAPRDLINEVREQFLPLQVIGPVPILVDPVTQGGIGVAGPRSASAAAARALVIQAASLHSPEDLVIACVASARSSQDWDWLKWLPHCHSPNSPLAVHLAHTAAGGAQVLNGVEALISGRTPTANDQTPMLPRVLLVVESDALCEFGRLVEIAEAGWARGIAMLWIATDLTLLPSACRVFLNLRDMAQGSVGYLHSGDEVTPVQVETINLEESRQWASDMAPISDLATRVDDASDIPHSVNLLSLAGFEPKINSASVLERWRSNRSIVVGPMAMEKKELKAGNLRAVIGQSAVGLHSLDLRTDGPHALVGGTTGAGKSELLQTWILAMAMSHTPQRLNFLLVDYKGGSAFSECNNLPHTVGLVTDLGKNGVRRALTSLAAELHYREKLITVEHKCKDLQKMEKQFPDLAPPSLVIVVDEFAALVQEVPEFIDGVVNVAQRGRSLGLHMILATQQPSGVIRGSLRANTNLRLALRVADPDDSQDILGTTAAAAFSPDTPGRAASKTGPGRLVSFQTGYVGGHADQVQARADVAVEELTFGVGSVWEVKVEQKKVAVDLGPSDIVRIVNAISEATYQAQLPAPRAPWLPGLKFHYNLSMLETKRRDTELIFGMLDEPERQSQIPVGFQPDVEGNMIVHGASGSGKTTLLRSLAVAAGFTIRGGPSQVYGLDFASGGLSMLSELPHVGSIIKGSDDERVQRLLRWISQIIEERSVRYRAVNAGTITEYRALSGKTDEPRILLLVDGVNAFLASYSDSSNFIYSDMLIEIAAQGRSVGVHLLLASDQRGGIPTALASSIQRRIVMRMADPDDYGFLGVKASILNADSPAGRCIMDDCEVQVAVLGLDSDGQSQATALKSFGDAMRKSGIEPAPAIRKLPELVPLASLNNVEGIPIGVDSSTFNTALIEPNGTFLVTGPSGSGRSTLLHTMIKGLNTLNVPITLLSDRGSAITSLPGFDYSITGADQIAVAISDLENHFKECSPSHPMALMIEGIGELAGTEADYPLAGLLRLAFSRGVFIVGEGEINALSNAYEIMKRFKAGRRGFILQPDDSQGHLLQATLPRCRANDFVVGRGFLIEKGKPRLVQSAILSKKT